ncbi:hypothetical protein R3P38DRAFT_2834808 [Favolaschia claudopus]|uniref:F-box domain-containing protein n=1 Tax=Favolaschia claudopus TaxID=2862362 RepID=A0AAW0EE17_9AGAR
MGQYWKVVVNLDNCQTFGHWGKLGEFLLGLPKCLEQSIEVPPKFPDIDNLVLAVKPGDVVKKRYNIKDRAWVFPETATQSSRFVNLPMDMLQEIYAHLDLLAETDLQSVVDILCLNATCQALWGAGRSIMYRQIERLAASYAWNGHRVLCIGDYLEDSDIPENVFTTPEEEAEFTDDGESSLYRYDFVEVKGDSFGYTPIFVELSARVNYQTFDMYGIRHLLTYSPPPPPMAHPTVLRNLTRKEYVRETALLELKAKYVKVKVMQQVGLGEALMTRICLSSDPSASLSYDGPIHQGAWVGDRFDIVSSAEWQETASWTDVSDQVLKDVEDIWRAEYGVKESDVPRVYT